MWSKIIKKIGAKAPDSFMTSLGDHTTYEASLRTYDRHRSPKIGEESSPSITVNYFFVKYPVLEGIVCNVTNDLQTRRSGLRFPR